MPTKLIVLALLMISFGPSQALGQQKYAQTAEVPAKIDLSPVHRENRLGEDVPVNLQLLDSYGHPVAAPQNINAEIKVEQPSGQTTTYSVTFAAGESSKQIPVPIEESGVAKLTVKQREQHLIGGSDFVLVRPQAKKGQKAGKPAKQQKSADESKSPNARVRDFRQLRGTHARLIDAAFLFQNPIVHHGEAAAMPQLQLTVSGENANGGTRADGITCARVQVFYLGTDDLQRDVQIWLSPSNGILDNNPIVIHKGSATGSACWTSLYPIPSATLTVAATNPPNFTFVSINDGADPKRASHKFTDNISGIEFVNPPQSITIVDSFNLTARFMNANGPVKLTDKRPLHFSTNSAVLKINPLQTIVDAGDFDSSTILVPTFFGKSTVEVFTPDYPAVTHAITITWIGVLIASLLGGLFGGILAWVNSAGKLWVRILTGLLVGLVASWAYVIVGLPKLDSSFLHNQLSVFFVALLVGLSGVKGATFISSKFNLPSF